MNSLENLNASKEIQQVKLSSICKDIVLGSLLGDGSLKIDGNYKNARLTIKHSEKQAEYFYWKAAQLQDIATTRSIQILKPTGYSKLRKLNFQSKASSELTTIHKHCYKNNALDIRRYWLNCMSARSLMIWWLDDGSIVGGGRQGVLCTDGFSYLYVTRLARYLEVMWGVHARIGPIHKNVTAKPRGMPAGLEVISTKVGQEVGREVPLDSVKQCVRNQTVPLHSASNTVKYKTCYRLWLSANELKKFLRIFMGEIPVESMIYKVILRYKDSNLQERWISEVKSAMILSENDIVQKFTSRPW